MKSWQKKQQTDLLKSKPEGTFRPIAITGPAIHQSIIPTLHREGVFKVALIGLGILFLLLLYIPTFAQKDSLPKEKQRTALKLAYFSKADYSTELVATLNEIIKRKPSPLSEALVSFEVAAGESDKVLGSAYTDEKGKAVLKLPANCQLPLDKTGSYNFSAQFEGNDSCAKSSAETTIKKIDFEINLTNVDSVKSIAVTASEVNDKGETVPVENTEVGFYIKRLFGALMIGDKTFPLEKGKCGTEFAVSVPGDSLGTIGIVARIEENELYGNVERMKTAAWGVPTFPDPPYTYKALWFLKYGLYWVFTLICLFIAYIIYRRLYASNTSKEVSNEKSIKSSFTERNVI